MTDLCRQAAAPAPVALAPWWLIIEAEPRWSAALRCRLLRDGRQGDAQRVVSATESPPPRSLWQSTAPVVIGLEVSALNLDERLSLTAQLRGAPLLCPVGLIDGPSFRPAAAPRVASGLLEAGATLTADSPREADRLIRHGSRFGRRATLWLSQTTPLPELLWRALPWQSPPWEIG